jgi:hypothetical protein
MVNLNSTKINKILAIGRATGIPSSLLWRRLLSMRGSDIWLWIVRLGSVELNAADKSLSCLSSKAKSQACSGNRLTRFFPISFCQHIKPDCHHAKI